MLAGTVAAPKSKRRSRKRRRAGAPPRARPDKRRELLATRRAAAPVHTRRASPLSAYGERPPSPFGGVPVSEIAIFAGGVGLVIGWARGGGPALIVGVIVCTLGVVEVTAREHFSGYRSHSMLLTAIPSLGFEVGFVALLGAPRDRALLLLAVAPVYAVLFLLLRKRFRTARHRRLARPPGT